MSPTDSGRRIPGLLAAAWLVAVLHSVRTLVGVPIAVWERQVDSWLGLWSLFTHGGSIVLALLAAILVWRGRDAGLVVLMLLSGNGLLYWTFYVGILGSTYWPVFLTLGLSVATLTILGWQAVRRLAGEA